LREARLRTKFGVVLQQMHLFGTNSRNAQVKIQIYPALDTLLVEHDI
jgi:hypothetical protein